MAVSRHRNMSDCTDVVKFLLNCNLSENDRSFYKDGLNDEIPKFDPLPTNTADSDGCEVSETDCYGCFQRCLIANWPCAFGAKMTSTWPIVKQWVDRLNGQPAWSFLSQKFGSAVVPVANCRMKHYNSQMKTETNFADYLIYWQNLIESGHDYDKNENLYLKDWHLIKEFPDYVPYETPFCFKSDWLNEFWDARTDSSDDYRFVYMGPKGSWTSLHSDVFNSYSWSANVCGLKKWTLFPPDEEENLKDANGKLAYDVYSDEMNDEKVYPNFGKVRKRYEVLQKAGEVIFVPSRWYHQVHNLEDTISVNHNWFNGFNIDFIWQSMKEMLCEVQHEIEDCNEMEGWNEQCQLILKSTYGMDFKEFVNLLKVIARSRLDLVSEWLDDPTASKSLLLDATLPRKQLKAIDYATYIFDLSRIESMFVLLEKKLSPESVGSDFSEILRELLMTLSKVRTNVNY